MKALDVKLIPIFDDNYVFVIVNKDSKSCVVVDPGDGQPVQDFLLKQGLALEAILLTHHHDDHIGGAQNLKETFKVPVYAPLKNKSEIAFATNYLVEGDSLTLLGDNLLLNVLELPGHTQGHIAYLDSKRNWLFSGDVLFGLGCGRLFEGTFQQGFTSLQRIKALPNETLVYCTHEYTEMNLRFCKRLVVSNDLKTYEDILIKKRTAGLPSVPLNLGVEKTVNPFLAANGVEQFTSLRELRNRG